MRISPTLFYALMWLALALVAVVPTISAQSLYADPRAARPGDMVTIVLAERTNAQRESAYDNASRASLGGGGTVQQGSDLSGRFALDASFNKEARSRNETVQRDVLQGTVTATVVGVDSTGNLQIQGERRLNVNGVTHLMRVSGTVRPFDIRANNTIFSYQVADAFIEYRRAGLGRKFLKPGFFAKAGAVAVLVGALILGAQ